MELGRAVYARTQALTRALVAAADASADDFASVASGSAGEERSRHAVHVLRRVRSKLLGTEIDLPRAARLSLSARADELVRRATAEENLCRLYEGEQAQRVGALSARVAVRAGWAPWI